MGLTWVYWASYQSGSHHGRVQENTNSHNGICGGQEPSLYNALLGRTGMKSLEAIASTIHSMIKFPTSNGIATIATTRETLRECRQIEEAQALSRHARVTDPTLMQTSSKVANPRVSRQLDKGKKPPKSSVEETIVNVDIFAWTPTDMTGIPKAIMEHSLDTYPHIEPQMQSLSGKLAALKHFLSKSAECSLPFLDTLKKCTNKKDFRCTKAAEAAFLEMKKLVSELPTLTTPKKGETPMMYLAVVNEVVSVVLLTERDRRQMPIHYVSRSLRGVKTNYAPMEKLALALVHAARRLRRYFQAHPIKVLADFLVDTSTEINATPEVASTPRVEDIPESSKARENLTPGPRAWRLYTDGASNNRGSGAGLILIAPDDVEYSYTLHLNLSNSNNDAEYEALLAGLRTTTKMQVKDIHAFVDSKLVASQVEGSYEAKGEGMIKYQEKILELAGEFNRFRINHIPRAENRKADDLSKLAAVQFDHLSKEVLVEVLNECSVEAQEVNMVVDCSTKIYIKVVRFC
nr:hypothetical protein [Tanacetum cinerariifolium]